MPSERGRSEATSVADGSVAGSPPNDVPADAADATDADADADAAADADTAADDLDTIAWGPVSHDRIRSVIVGTGLAVLLAVVAAAAAIGTPVAWTAVSSLGSVSPGSIASTLAGVTFAEVFVTAAFALVIAILVVPYLYLSVHDRERTGGSLRDRFSGRSSLRPGWLLLGAAIPVSVWAIGLDWTALGVWPLVIWLWAVPFALLWEGVEVELDPETRTVDRSYPAHDRSRTDDLNAVVRTRRIDVPRAGTVFLLAYRGNEWYRSTPWLTVPRARANAVESAIDDVLARSTGPDRASVPKRAVLALIGCSTVPFGLALSVAGEGSAAIALAALSAPFTLVFLALAARL